MEQVLNDFNFNGIMRSNVILWNGKVLLSNAVIFFFFMVGIWPEDAWSREQIHSRHKNFFGINRNHHSIKSKENLCLLCMDTKVCLRKEKYFVQLPDELAVYFKKGSARLGTQSKSDLDSICAVLRKFPELMINLEGYSDRKDCLRNTRSLSERRLEVCVSYLVASGISRERINSKAFGATTPMSESDLTKVKRSNRKVAMVLIGR